jgi:hypothetical protein
VPSPDRASATRRMAAQRGGSPQPWCARASQLIDSPIVIRDVGPRANRCPRLAVVVPDRRRQRTVGMFFIVDRIAALTCRAKSASRRSRSTSYSPCAGSVHAWRVSRRRHIAHRCQLALRRPTHGAACTEFGRCASARGTVHEHCLAIVGDRELVVSPDLPSIA